MKNSKKIACSMRKNIPLCRYTTFRIGGPADFFVKVTSIRQLREAINFAMKHKIPLFVLGGGSNLLINDKGIRGLVIKNCIKGIRRRNNCLTVKSGEKLSHLLDFAAKEGLSGVEFAAGIPGTLGGALYGNAGAYGKAMGDFLTAAKIINSLGAIEEVGREYFQFQYRKSQLKQTGDILIEATFQLKPGNPEDIQAEMSRIIEERCGKHPDKKWGCAGSYFKNIDPPSPQDRRIAAGLILDKAGCKGLTFGSAAVYPNHANFLTNPGGATACEVLALANILKNKVKEQFDIDLEEEVLYVDEFLTQWGKFKKT